MHTVPYWLNIGSILHQYGCATTVTTTQQKTGRRIFGAECLVLEPSGPLVYT